MKVRYLIKRAAFPYFYAGETPEGQSFFATFGTPMTKFIKEYATVKETKAALAKLNVVPESRFEIVKHYITK